MAVFIGPPKPQHGLRHTWRYRCNAPTPGQNFLNGQRCGQQITGWKRGPIEVPSSIWREFAPGPLLTHLPCGHEWWISGGGWAAEPVPWAKAAD